MALGAWVVRELRRARWAHSIHSTKGHNTRGWTGGGVVSRVGNDRGTLDEWEVMKRAHAAHIELGARVSGDKREGISTRGLAALVALAALVSGSPHGWALGER